jgi:hypothetical protein
MSVKGLNYLKPIFVSLLLLHSALFASFNGVVIDKESRNPIENAKINDSNQTVLSKNDGSFFIKSDEKKYFVKAYGYRPFSFSQDSNTSIMELEPITVKALYLTFWGASNSSATLKKILKIIDETELNAIVVDVKNEYGLTSFATTFEQANSYGAHKKRTNRNIEKFMKKLKEKKIYTIARIVTFKDELQAVNNPDYAVKKADGIIWRNLDSMAWVDPFDKRSHNYNISIAEEAAKVGFDEINFDYIRFPAKKTLKFAKQNNPQNRVDAITEFIDTAQNRLRKYGVFISVDTFGNICWTDDDNNIGQTVESLADHADYIAPMLYPSGFSKGSFNYKYPSEHPYSVIYRSIRNLEKKIDTRRVRPWLQHFRDYAHKKRKYEKFEVNAQIRAARHVNTNGWMLWSPSSDYYLNYFN